jgi:hypothetical protein
MFPPLYYDLAQAKVRDLELRLGHADIPAAGHAPRTDGAVRPEDSDFCGRHDDVEAPVLAEIRPLRARARIPRAPGAGQDAAAGSCARRVDWGSSYRPA